MLQIMQEAVLPKLSQSSLYAKFDQSSGVTQALREELANCKEFIQTPDSMKEIVALMQLNGDAIIKKAVEAWTQGDIVVIFNHEESKIPSVLPYIVIGQAGSQKCYVFADKLMTRLTSTNEYINFMAGLEAGFLALKLQQNPDRFVSNRNVMLIFADLYQFMATCPLEVRLYMKGDNLTKAMMYCIAFYYKLIDGENMSKENINFKRLLRDQLNNEWANQIVSEVKALESNSFMDVLELIKKINPVRYGNLDAVYLQQFIACCGVYITFALENPQYLFLLMTSASYKTKLTSFNMNKLVGTQSKKCITQLVSMV